MKTIDLNCDMGEGMMNDKDIMPYISSANIACGFHAGDEHTMWDTIELAMQHGVAIGAHISFLDKKNFGRTEQHLSFNEIYELITQQLIVFYEMADSFDIKVKHVKPHGALYNMSAKDKSIADAIAKAVKEFDEGLVLFGLSNSLSIKEAKAIGLKTANEFFADRNYTDNGALVPRSESNALIADAPTAAMRVVEVVNDGEVKSVSGKQIRIEIDTLCIHGDGKDAADFAKNINECLKQNNIDIKSL